MSISRCEKHELAGCATCSGAEARHQQSLIDPTVDRGSLPYIPGGVTIHAKFAGRCAGCGADLAVGTPIHRSNAGDQGWVGVECCA